MLYVYLYMPILKYTIYRILLYYLSNFTFKIKLLFHCILICFRFTLYTSNFSRTVWLRNLILRCLHIVWNFFQKLTQSRNESYKFLETIPMSMNSYNFRTSFHIGFQASFITNVTFTFFCT